MEAGITGLKRMSVLVGGVVFDIDASKVAVDARFFHRIDLC